MVKHAPPIGRGTSRGSRVAAEGTRMEEAGMLKKLFVWLMCLFVVSASAPGAAISALRRLQAMFGNESDIFASHPAPGDRAAALEKLQAGPAQEFSRGL